MQKRVPTYPAGFTLIELILVIIVLGALSAIAVPRLPDTGLFEDTYDARQVVSALNRARAHALASQCHVLVRQVDDRLDARVDSRCGSGTLAYNDDRDFQPNSDTAGRLEFLAENLGGRNPGLENPPRLIFTPTGQARKVGTSADLSAFSLDSDLSDFSGNGGTLELSHQSGTDIQIDDTTGYVR